LGCDNWIYGQTGISLRLQDHSDWSELAGEVPYVEMSARDPNKMQNLAHDPSCLPLFSVPFGVTYEKIGTIQRRGFLLDTIFTLSSGVPN
jgi:hypothetical protein